MAVNPYSVPFRPLDFSGLGEVADVYARASQNRDINDMRRRELDLRERTLSAEEYRKTQEYQDKIEERKRAREIERIKAFGDAKRMAMQDPALATSLYKSPFGFSFMKTQDLGPGEEGPQLSPNAPTNRPPQVEAPVQQIADQVDAVSGGAATPPPDAPAAAPIPPATPRMRLFADTTGGQQDGFGGTTSPQWNEVSSPHSPTGRGPKYDAIYAQALEASGDTRYAFDKAEADYQKDTDRAGLAQRMRDDDARAAAAKAEDRAFQRELAEKYRSEALTFDQRMQLARAGASVNAPQGSSGVLQSIAEYIASIKADPAQMAGAYQLAEAGGLRGKAGADIVEKIRDDYKTGRGGGPTAAGDVFGPGGKKVATIPSSGDPALDRKRSEDVSKANAIYTDLYQKLGQLEEARKGGFALPTIGGFAPSAKGARRESLHGEILLQLKELQKLGVLAGPDMGLMEGQIGSALSNTTGIGASKLGNMQQILDQKHARFLDTNGIDGTSLLPVLRGGSSPKPSDKAPASATPPARGVPAGSKREAGKVGPNGRAVYRAPDGTLHEED